MTLPYSDGHAEAKKSELFNRLVFKLLTTPPLVLI